MSRTRLIALFVFLGAAMVAVGWVLEDEGYVSDLLLQLGSAVLLLAPLVYVERLITREIDQVRDELEDLRRRAEAVAVPYERVRSEQPSGSQRTATMEDQIDRARENAHIGKHSPDDVAALFASGSPGERIYALGLMQAKPSLASVDSIVDGIAESRSAFEQFHALLLVQQIWQSLIDEDRQKVLEAIETQLQPGGYIRPGTDRHELIREIWRKA